MHALRVFSILTLVVLANAQIDPNDQNPSARCQGIVRIRKDYRDLSDTEWLEFSKALLVLHTPTGDNSLTKFEALAKKHWDSTQVAHKRFPFLMWHRYFLAEYEDALRLANPGFTAMPYWDWSVDNKAPQSASLFTEKYLGATNSNGNQAACIINSAFADFTANYPQNHCVKRGFEPTTGFNAAMQMAGQTAESYQFPDSATINDGILNYKEFTGFTGALQLFWHQNMHVWIGGNSGDMTSLRTSALDPTFLLHHAFLDFIYSMWSDEHPDNNIAYARNETAMSPYGKAIFATNTKNLCYQYQKYSKSSIGTGVSRSTTSNSDNNSPASLAPVSPPSISPVSINTPDTSAQPVISLPMESKNDFSLLNGVPDASNMFLSRLLRRRSVANDADEGNSVNNVKPQASHSETAKIYLSRLIATGTAQNGKVNVKLVKTDQVMVSDSTMNAGNLQDQMYFCPSNSDSGVTKTGTDAVTKSNNTSSNSTSSSVQSLCIQFQNGTVALLPNTTTTTTAAPANDIQVDKANATTTKAAGSTKPSTYLGYFKKGQEAYTLPPNHNYDRITPEMISSMKLNETLVREGEAKYWEMIHKGNRDAQSSRYVPPSMTGFILDFIKQKNEEEKKETMNNDKAGNQTLNDVKSLPTISKSASDQTKVDNDTADKMVNDNKVASSTPMKNTTVKAVNNNVVASTVQVTSTAASVTPAAAHVVNKPVVDNISTGKSIASNNIIKSIPADSLQTSDTVSNKAPMSNTITSVSSASPSNIIVSNVQASNASVSNAPTSSVQASSVPVSNMPINNAPVSNVPTSSVQATSVPVSNMPINNAPVSNAPTSSVQASNVPINNAPTNVTPNTTTPTSSLPIDNTAVNENTVNKTTATDTSTGSTTAIKMISDDSEVERDLYGLVAKSSGDTIVGGTPSGSDIVGQISSASGDNVCLSDCVVVIITMIAVLV